MEINGTGSASFAGFNASLSVIADQLERPAGAPPPNNVVRLVPSAPAPTPQQEANAAVVETLRRMLADAEAGKITQVGVVVFMPGIGGWAQFLVANDPHGLIGALDTAKLTVQMGAGAPIGMLRPLPPGA